VRGLARRIEDIVVRRNDDDEGRVDRDDIEPDVSARREHVCIVRRRLGPNRIEPRVVAAPALEEPGRGRKHDQIAERIKGIETADGHGDLELSSGRIGRATDPDVALVLRAQGQRGKDERREGRDGEG